MPIYGNYHVITATSPQLQGSVEMFGSFDFHGHTCIVFEVLGKSVFDFLKDNGFTAFPLSQIQRIADDMISALSFLHGNLSRVMVTHGNKRYHLVRTRTVCTQLSYLLLPTRILQVFCIINESSLSIQSLLVDNCNALTKILFQIYKFQFQNDPKGIKSKKC